MQNNRLCRALERVSSTTEHLRTFGLLRSVCEMKGRTTRNGGRWRILDPNMTLGHLPRLPTLLVTMKEDVRRTLHLPRTPLGIVQETWIITQGGRTTCRHPGVFRQRTILAEISTQDPKGTNADTTCRHQGQLDISSIFLPFISCLI